jgi:hypothetical protein
VELGCVETEDLPTIGAIRYIITDAGLEALDDPGISADRATS